jgi:hypothetical protein
MAAPVPEIMHMSGSTLRSCIANYDMEIIMIILMMMIIKLFILRANSAATEANYSVRTTRQLMIRLKQQRHVV